MNAFFNPANIARTYSDPVAWLILAVDLFPIYAVLVFGWGAAPLVFLYWLENLVIGAVTLARMMATAMQEHPVGLIAMLFIGPFFIVHYGMFCFVHGVFVHVFASMNTGGSPDFLGPVSLIQSALNSAPHMTLFILAIIALQAFLFVRDFLMRGQYRETTIQEEMMAPYGRILVLHFGLFVGMAAMIALGQPMLGILALILLRAVWGIFLTMRRRMHLDRKIEEKVDAPSPI